MQEIRKIVRSSKGNPTSDGAGVRLKRAFGPEDADLLDPFLLLDHFGSDDPDDYMAGFPMHPHRGIETITYILKGTVDHRDSTGRTGAINAGDIQWMTAGSGIMHQEMPRLSPTGVNGFQLWVNLPRARKMMDPRYRDVRKETIPTVEIGNGAEVKVVAGKVKGTPGPVRDLILPVEFLDVTLNRGGSLEREIPSQNNAFAYVFEGSVKFMEGGLLVETEHLAIFGRGDGVMAEAGPDGARFLLVSGRPIKEPIAWGGPVVMNTEEELDTAFREIHNGTFIKTAAPIEGGKK
ncbi:MAG TPA: pirin family protein [Methanomassiliicoccales archaeon]